MRALKRKKQLGEMARKLLEWKRAGYDTMGLEYRLRGMSKKDMAMLVKRIKKRYKTEEYKKKK